MNKKQIKIILEDIYKVDETLRNYAPQLEKIVVEILEARPDVEIDEKFKKELYKELMSKAEELKPIKRINIWQWIFAKKISYAFVGALAVIVILVGINYSLDKGGLEIFQPNVPQAELKFTKTSVGENAFGSLIGDQSTDESAQSAAPAGRGGGSGGGGLNVSEAGIAMSDQKICAGEGCIIPPYYFPEYVYIGEDITLEETKVEVLKRKNRNEYLGILKSFGFGLADLTAFEDAKIQTVNFVQDKPYGYSVFINFDESTISIDTYWPKWPQPYSRCADDKCYEELRLKLTDISSDEELIGIANRFINEHGINLTGYGQPEIENEWRNQPAVAESQIYVPDSITLVYPLLIDNKFVYEQGGTKFGVRVGINIREKRVSGVYNLSLQEYESSMYEAETDFSKILEVAKRGGMNMYSWTEGQSTQVEIGTPSQEYLVFWKYDQASQLNQMLIVPALVFPVSKTPTDGYYYYLTKIIVPLTKELLSQNEIFPYPMPLKETQSSQ